MITVRVKNNVPEALFAFSSRLQDVMVDGANEVRDRIASRAVVLYMREAGSERGVSGRFLPRLPGDTGPLRILSGRLGSSILGSLSSQNRSSESIYELSSSPTEVRLRWGSRTPYANIQERGGVVGRGAVIHARPYITPATRDTEPELPSIFETRIQALAVEVGL